LGLNKSDNNQTQGIYESDGFEEAIAQATKEAFS